jgi:hypothetical protein
VNQPYCATNQQECTEFFNDCMLLAAGELHDKVLQSIRSILCNYFKYFIGAIMSCIFAFTTTLLYWVKLNCQNNFKNFLKIFSAKLFLDLRKERKLSMLEGNDILVTDDSLHRSLSRNTWQFSQRKMSKFFKR